MLEITDMLEIHGPFQVRLTCWAQQNLLGPLIQSFFKLLWCREKSILSDLNVKYRDAVPTPKHIKQKCICSNHHL